MSRARGNTLAHSPGRRLDRLAVAMRLYRVTHSWICFRGCADRGEQADDTAGLFASADVKKLPATVNLLFVT